MNEVILRAFDSSKKSMKTLFVSRHAGAIDWIKSTDLKIDVFREHLDLNEVQEGDVVIGVLPISMAAQVCAKGARFIGLEIMQTRDSRGRELSVEELSDRGCKLQEFFIEAV